MLEDDDRMGQIAFGVCNEKWKKFKDIHHGIQYVFIFSVFSAKKKKYFVCRML